MIHKSLCSLTPSRKHGILMRGCGFPPERGVANCRRKRPMPPNHLVVDVCRAPATPEEPLLVVGTTSVDGYGMQM